MRRRPRWVVDTNVLVSAFLWQGKPERVVEMDGEKQVQLVTSRALLDELAATLAKKKLARYVAATGLTADQIPANYRRIATLVTARGSSMRGCRAMPTTTRCWPARWPLAPI